MAESLVFEKLAKFSELYAQAQYAWDAAEGVSNKQYGMTGIGELSEVEIYTNLAQNSLRNAQIMSTDPVEARRWLINHFVKDGTLYSKQMAEEARRYTIERDHKLHQDRADQARDNAQIRKGIFRYIKWRQAAKSFDRATIHSMMVDASLDTSAEYWDKVTEASRQNT